MIGVFLRRLLSMGFIDFNEFLHALRTQELRKIPTDAKVILSAGCAGRKYFDWINQSHPGITRHFGIEAYLAKPDDLPNEVIWLPDNLSNMKSVANNEVDLVFAGQTVEHLWPDEFAGFLCEAYRVLKPAGLFVLDSPNRFITQAINWYHPEHTMELLTNEIIELVTLAGFSDILIKGIWLCYDSSKGSFMPLLPDLENIDIENDYRVIQAHDHPEGSFIWWVEARKNPLHIPNMNRLLSLSNSIFNQDFARSLHRVFTVVGKFQQYGQSKIIVGAPHQPGYIRFGPYIPLRPGNYIAQFNISYPKVGKPDQQLNYLPAIKIDVTSITANKIIAEKEIPVIDLVDKSSLFLSNKGMEFRETIQSEITNVKFTKHEIKFSLEKVEFGVEFRVFTIGHIPIIMDASVQLVEEKFG